MSIPKANIQAKNLNLLVVFNALLENTSVSEAAKQLKMSQPNLSRALKLLRTEFDDALFVRTSKGITPTKRALELSPLVRESLHAIQKIYSRTLFDPKTAVGRFTIFTTDYLECLLASRLAAVVSEEAPGITLNFRPSQGHLPKSAMENGECDLCLLVVRETIPPGYFKQDLFEDPYVCAVRKKHPILSGKLSLERFLEYGHTMITPQGLLWAITDEKLLKMGKKRQMVFGSPNSLSNVFVVAKSDLILTATRRFLETAQEFVPIEMFKGPFEIEPIKIAQIWHERSKEDPLNQWLRQKIKSILVKEKT